MKTPFKYNDDPMKMLEERLGTERLGFLLLARHA